MRSDRSATPSTSGRKARCKTYDSEEEKELRLKIRVDNHEFVQKHNAEYENGEHTHFVGLNHLADLTKDEFKKMLGYNAALRAPAPPLTPPPGSTPT